MTRIPTHRLSPGVGTTSAHDTGEDWRARGACRDEDPEMFFPIGNTGLALLQIEDAKAVCRRCPVIDTCLRWALETGQDHGVWGGLSEDERRARKRRDAYARRTNPTATRKPPTDPSKTDPTNRPTCGTYTGYEAHTRKRERQCDACRAWKAATRAEATPDLCGTLPGYRRHQAAQEDACSPCRAAKAASSAQYRRQQRSNAA